MKNIKITPVLLLSLILIIRYILNVYYNPRTPFYVIFMIGFVIIMCLILFFDRFLVMYFKLKGVWITELILILLVIFLVLRGCS